MFITSPRHLQNYTNFVTNLKGMERQNLSNSELVLTDDKRIYHLKLSPEDIADTIILVGDPGRVRMMSKLFDTIELRVENREFVTHTGQFRGKRISVISTGIGTDNIDIVINELDALANIDFNSRKCKQNLKSLKLIRIGTSGALQSEIEPGSVIISGIACGLDNLMYYYKGLDSLIDDEIAEKFRGHMNWPSKNSLPYFIPAPGSIIDKIKLKNAFKGITIAAPGFYGPQGRSLRLPIFDTDYIDKISSFFYNGLRINNFEMEGSALYGLSSLLGHEALTICIALANRRSGKFITEYHDQINQLLNDVLENIGE